jgi:CelD/BcsL family acetyltransferase involved in cellulose biosynthesis
MTQVTQAVRQAPTAAHTAIRVECVDSAWGLTTLRPQWNALLRASAANGPFLTWEWLHAWWTHLGAAASLKIIAVREGSELIGVAPFRVEPHMVPWFSRLRFLGTGHAGSDYLDLIVRSGREDDAIRAIARFLKTQQMTVRLDRLPEASLGAQLADQLKVDGWVASTAPDGVCPLIPLAGHTWDSYLSTLGAAHRANVRRRLRGIEQQFQARFELITTENARKSALDAMAGFHERRFQSSGGSTAFMTPAVRAFQDEATWRALDRGWLRMYVLRLDGDVAAVMYGFFYDRRFYFYNHGFDDRYSRHSIGLVLMALTIRAAIDEGAQAFDLLWGTEAYKSLWARETRTLRRIHLFPPHAAGRIHRCADEARRRLGPRPGRVCRRQLSVMGVRTGRG